MARGRRPKIKLKLKKETVYGLFAVGLALGAFLSVLSEVYPKGFLLTKINTLLELNFAWTAWFLPVFLIILAGLFSQIKIKWLKLNLPIGLLFIWASTAGLTQSGGFGLMLWKNMEIILPIGIAVVVFFICILLFGLTVFLNLSLGEAVNHLFAGISVFVNFIKTYFKFDFPKFKKPEPVFVKDQIVTAKNEEKINLPVENKKPIIIAQSPVAGPAQNPSGEPVKIWEYPPLDLLSDSPIGQADRGDVSKYSNTIEKTLDSFGITARIAEVNKGPAVTQYALEIAQGTKIAKITSLQNDLALALAAPTGQVRIEAPIPGRSLVGVEIPNRTPEFVPLRKIMESDVMRYAKSKLTVALGLDVAGRPIIADIARMPHVLVAGATGSGKSICINSFITSLLMRNSPNELKLILIDPKRVELTLYNNIPHLLTPVVVELDKILSALKWALVEMDRRYKLFSQAGVRNIDSYNEASGFQALPYIVIFIDELAEVMMFAPNDVEDSVCRIAQLARATGIHLVLSTQRPSVDVITGLIKANISCRITFQVNSMIDSRVIIDSPGAEKLLGRGDMLYIPPDQSKPTRIQGTFISEKEVNQVVKFLKDKGGPVEYAEEVTNMPKSSGVGINGGGNLGDDPMVSEAIKLVVQHKQASASFLQRKLSIGYARAARVLDVMQDLGVVGPADGSKPREVLIKELNDDSWRNFEK